MRLLLLPVLLLTLAACGDNPVPEGPSTEPSARGDTLTFTASLRPHHVVTGQPEDSTQATAEATAWLIGNQLMVEGTFRDLSSSLRDIEDTPDDPGIHIHPGAEGEENSYLYGLQVTLNPDERSGRLHGVVELTEDEVALLLSERLYLDIHTTQHDPGEVRDQLRPADPDGVAARAAVAPGVALAAVLNALCTDVTPCRCHG